MRGTPGKVFVCCCMCIYIYIYIHVHLCPYMHRERYVDMEPEVWLWGWDCGCRLLHESREEGPRVYLGFSVGLRDTESIIGKRFEIMVSCWVLPPHMNSVYEGHIKGSV